MAENTIHIEFDPCEPVPAGGYKVRYRPLGSGGAYRNPPSNFFSSPISFVDNLDPAGTSYEGFIQGDCGGGKLGVSVPWVAEFTGSVAPSSEAPSSVAPSSSAPPPSPCEGICGRYQAIGENPSGTLFTWVDCEGGVGEQLITMGDPPFIFCTCDDDPQYSTTDVTVSRVGSCHDFNAITVRHAEVEETICGLIGFTAYLLAPATSITSGVTVYASEDIGDPLTGKSYIDDTTGPIYNIDPGTGLVGAPTGNAC
jgi:hypothetical protein